MHLTFDIDQLLSSSALPTSTSKDNMVLLGTSTQNLGSRGSLKENCTHKRNWKPRKHQRNDKTNWARQNNQSRGMGWRYGDKQRMDAMKA